MIYHFLLLSKIYAKNISDCLSHNCMHPIKIPMSNFYTPVSNNLTFKQEIMKNNSNFMLYRVDVGYMPIANNPKLCSRKTG